MFKITPTKNMKIKIYDDEQPIYKTVGDVTKVKKDIREFLKEKYGK